MADFFIREDDCSQDAYKEQMHINLFHVIGSALVEMLSDLYGQGNETFDASVTTCRKAPCARSCRATAIRSSYPH